jgi:hypothetical protein
VNERLDDVADVETAENHDAQPVAALYTEDEQIDAQENDEGGKKPSRPSNIETPEVQPIGLRQFLEQQRRDEEARQNEEEADSGTTRAGRLPGVVAGDDEQDREPAQPIESSDVTKLHTGSVSRAEIHLARRRSSLCRRLGLRHVTSRTRAAARAWTVPQAAS